MTSSEPDDRSENQLSQDPPSLVDVEEVDALVPSIFAYTHRTYSGYFL